MDVFGPKPGVNPLGKMSIFQVFELLVFKVCKGLLSFHNIVKAIFLTYLAKKKKVEKWPYLDQNHGLTPLDKRQIFDCVNVLFL